MKPVKYRVHRKQGGMGTLHTGFGKGLLDTGVVFFRPDLSSLGESLILVWTGFHG
jgi:hypothetical protein